MIPLRGVVREHLQDSAASPESILLSLLRVVEGFSVFGLRVYWG